MLLLLGTEMLMAGMQTQIVVLQQLRGLQLPQENDLGTVGQRRKLCLRMTLVRHMTFEANWPWLAVVG